MEKVWYKGVTYENAKELVKENLVNTVAAFIASGYWLKYIRDSCDYEKDGYQSLWDCAEKEFGLKISEASRAMGMNDKYAIDGNSPYMAESYKSYNKSQLQEMLTMSDEQIEQVTPDMTVREIREIKNPKPEKQFCDVAKAETDTVDTECEEEITEDIVTEIEVIPEAEEPLNMEFDTEELLRELDDVVDAEYQEVAEPVEDEPDAQENVVEVEQPAFPILKSDKQRRAWIEDVAAWGLWYEDRNIQAIYYKYDFPDGSRLIAVKYRYTCPPWLKDDAVHREQDGTYKYTHYHMIYSEEYKKNHEYEYDNYYTNETISISSLVEFIKEISKRGNKSE